MPDNADAAFGANHARIYAEGPPRQVPGFDSLHRMTIMLLAERVPPQGRVLVHGAGGGLELKAFADTHPAASRLHRCGAGRPVRRRLQPFDVSFHCARGARRHAAGDSSPPQAGRPVSDRACLVRPAGASAHAMDRAPRQLCRYRSGACRGRKAGDRNQAVRAVTGRGRGDAARGRIFRCQPVLCRAELPRLDRIRLISRVSGSHRCATTCQVSRRSDRMPSLDPCRIRCGRTRRYRDMRWRADRKCVRP